MLLSKFKIIFFGFFYLIVIRCASLNNNDSLKSALSKSVSKEERSEIYTQLAKLEAGNNVDQSNIYAKLALKELKDLQTKKAGKLSAGAYRILGVNYFYNGNNDSSIWACQKALYFSETANDFEGMADAYLSMQLSYRETGNYPKAVEVSSKALKFYEKSNQVKGQAKAILNIGILYGDQKLHKRSLEYLNKARELFFQLNDTAQWANATTRVGNVYMETEDQDTAKILYLEALKLFQSIHHKRGIAVIYNNLAGLTRVFSIDESLNYYELALKARMELGDKVSVSMIYGNIGSTYMNKQNYSKALENLNKSLELAIEMNSKENLPNIYKLIAGCYKKQNNLPKAFDALSKYAELKDSLFNKESIEKIEEIQTKYETEKKEQEIKLLNTTNSLKEIEIEKNKVEIGKQNQQKILIALALAFFIVVSGVVFRSYRVTKKSKEIIYIQKKEIEIKKNEVDEKQKEIVDSINYARRIQYALLANKELLEQNLDEYFIAFKPKDIVSGDFYWAVEFNNKFYIAVCDSTGHGVPGAFMSLLNIGFLGEAIKEKAIVEPHEVLNYVRDRLIESISKEEQQDGMDGILLCIDKLNGKITYAAANNSPVIIQDNQISELPKDKMPVGKGERMDSFKSHTINFQKGDTLYLYTDGFADQFGGPKGKKFKYKPLNDLLLNVKHLSLSEQQKVLVKTFTEWKGDLEQVDDVLIIGIRM